MVFTEPFPQHVIIAWIIIAIVFLATVVFLLVRDIKSGVYKQVGHFNPYNPPVDIEYVK